VTATDVKQSYPLRVATWNVQHASVVRSRDQADWLAAQTFADVVILTEVGVAAGTAPLANILRDRGYAVCLPQTSCDRTVLIASRIGTVTTNHDAYPGRLPHRALVASVDLPHGGRCGLVGLYVPSRGPTHRRNVDKRAFQTDVATALPQLIAQVGEGPPVIVGGDLNVVAPGHRPHHPVFGSWEYAFYDAFGHAGLVDAWRHLHPDHDDHSWFGRARRGYRFDYLFTTDAHAVTEAAYVHEPRHNGLSDHAAHTITLLICPPH
jgi:exodeoxyribonuclease-3